MRQNPFPFLCGFAAAVVALSATAKPTRFDVKDAAFRNLVQFSSDAILEKTVGTSHFIGGWVEFDPENLKAPFKGEWEVDTRSFEVGPDSKAQRLRDTLISPGEFPGVFYKADKMEVNVDGMVPGKPVTGRVSGVLQVRGVTRRQEITFKATYLPQSELTAKRMPGNLVKMSANFDLTLADIRFSLPENLVGLIANTIKVTVDMIGSDSMPAGQQ